MKFRHPGLMIGVVIVALVLVLASYGSSNACSATDLSPAPGISQSVL